MWWCREYAGKMSMYLILTNTNTSTSLLKTLQWQEGLVKGQQAWPIPQHIPRGQMAHSSAMHYLILTSTTTPPLSWVLRLTLAILPCSRHSCSSSLSFTVDANGLGSKRHHGSTEQERPYPGANPQQPQDSKEGLKPSTPKKTHTT